MFAQNEGALDRILRIGLGLGLLAWFLVDQGTGFGHWVKLIGIMPLATGLLGSCPLYTLLGLSTCPMKRS